MRIKHTNQKLNCSTSVDHVKEEAKSVILDIIWSKMMDIDNEVVNKVSKIPGYDMSWMAEEDVEDGGLLDTNLSDDFDDAVHDFVDAFIDIMFARANNINSGRKQSHKEFSKEQRKWIAAADWDEDLQEEYGLDALMAIDDILNKYSDGTRDLYPSATQVASDVRNAAEILNMSKDEARDFLEECLGGRSLEK